jgi:hypothetical protein
MVEQATVARVEPRLGQFAGRLHRLREVGEVHRRAGPKRRPRLEAHPRLGDHAKGALRAGKQPLRGRTGAGPRQSSRLHHAARCHDAHGLYELVDVRVEGREMAPGTGRDPAAQRRPLKRLWVMAQREAVRLQLRFEGRSERPGSDSRGAGSTVDLEHAVKMAKIEADGAAVAVTDIGFDAAGHAGAAPEGNDRDAGAAGPFEDRCHLLLVARKRNEIGCVPVVTAKRAHEIAKRSPVRVARPIVRVRAEGRLERGRWRNAGRAEVELLGLGRLLDADALDTEPVGEGRAELLELDPPESLVLHAPAPKLALRDRQRRRHRQQPRAVVTPCQGTHRAG